VGPSSARTAVSRLVLVSEHKGKLNVVTSSVIPTTAEF
jgi:hypothetical protein